MEGRGVDHHWDPTWLHRGEYVIQLQQPRQQRHTMCPLRWGRSGDKNQSHRWWRQRLINTWNQATNSHNNSRVSERKHFVKQTVCSLIAVFSHSHSLSQQLSLMWRWSGLRCSGHFLLLFSGSREGCIQRGGVQCINVRSQTSCVRVQLAFCLGAVPLLKETCRDAAEMILQPNC